MPLILVCFVAACHKWVPLESPMEKSLTESRGKLRLTLNDDERLVFDFATVDRDSVYAIRGDDPPVAIPLSEIVKVEQRKDNLLGTILLSYAGVAAVVIPVVIVTCTDEDGC